jgi:hypothetical protein
MAVPLADSWVENLAAQKGAQMAGKKGGWMVAHSVATTEPLKDAWRDDRWVAVWADNSV